MSTIIVEIWVNDESAKENGLTPNDIRDEIHQIVQGNMDALCDNTVKTILKRFQNDQN